MSGNPFRASIVVQNHPAAAFPTSSPPADSSNRESEGADRREHGSVLDALSAPLQKTKKSVRIESLTEMIPPHPAFSNADPESNHIHGRRYHVDSPPAAASSAVAEGFAERYPQDIAGTEVDGRTTAPRLSENSETLASAFPVSSAPANPFSRTLATIEPPEQYREATEQLKDRTPTDKPMPGAKRQSLNVEGFKNLLMQGISSPRGSGLPRQLAPSSNPSSLPLAALESSSTELTPSVSRQSALDATQNLHTDSPRTSYDMALSDDERTGLVGGEVRKEKKKPPPAPRHRHGKLVKERTPQTVPFDSFSAADVSLDQEPPRKNGVPLNKPLPPTPPDILSPTATHDSNYDGTLASGTNDEVVVSLPGVDASPKPVQRKVPPPVPLARRQSQLRSSTTGNRSRSNSSLTASSQQSLETIAIHQSQENTLVPHQASSQKAPPPPLPARRHGSTLPAINADPSSEQPRSVTASPNTPSSRRTTLESQTGTPVPISGLIRTSSKHSPRNTSRAVSNDGTGGGVGMPPPPPPPRRRQSDRSSLDMQRPNVPLGSPSPVHSRQTSAEWNRNSRASFDGKRQGSIASVSSLSREYTLENEKALYSPREEADEPNGLRAESHSGTDKQTDGEGGDTGEGRSNANNILDDMEKFQQEIDELRSRYEKGA